ncbi:MAG: MCE family protein [Gammaproteobacteria bacterium]|jgi:phospholipid/cholesterol/gamma-HCH transport system substrate-binding protein|nr:MCE family protein [Gammaproteobacteria bacterium]
MSRLNRLYSPPELSAPGKRAAHGRRRDLALAGLFVLAMAAVVVGLMTLLAPGLLIGHPFRAYFLEADGLDSGMDVMLEGYVIGRVRALEPVFVGDPDRDQCPQPTDPRAPTLPCFRASLSLQPDWSLPAGSVVQLASAGLLRGNVLRIIPGTKPETLAPGSPLATVPRAPDLVTQVQSTLVQAQQTLDETIRPTLTRIQDRIQGLLALFRDDAETDEEGADGIAGGPGSEVGRDLAAVVTNLTQLSRDIEQSVDPEQIQAILTAVQTLSENLAAVSETLPSRSADIQAAVNQYGALADQLSVTVEAARPSLQGSLNDARYALQELAAALAPILTNVENASRNLSALSRELREDPVSLLRGHEEEDPTPWFER